MEQHMITCINCPVGCRMTVTVENGQVTKVEGNTCIRGDKYARQECVMPLRMVTAVVSVEGSNMPLSVKTRTPVPKAKIKECMAQLAKVHLTSPVRSGTVVIPDVCGTGVDIIATKTVE